MPNPVKKEVTAVLCRESEGFVWELGLLLQELAESVECHHYLRAIIDALEFFQFFAEIPVHRRVLRFERGFERPQLHFVRLNAGKRRSHCLHELLGGFFGDGTHAGY